MAALDDSARFTYASGTDRGRILNVTPAPALWDALLLDHPTGAFVTQNGAPTVNGWQVAQKLTLPLVGLSVGQWRLMQRLSSGAWWALLEDRQGRWWWLGQERGIRAAASTGATGVFAAEQGEALELVGREPLTWREVLPARAQAWWTAAVTDGTTPGEPDLDTPIDGDGGGGEGV